MECVTNRKIEDEKSITVVSCQAFKRLLLCLAQHLSLVIFTITMTMSIFHSRVFTSDVLCHQAMCDGTPSLTIDALLLRFGEEGSWLSHRYQNDYLIAALYILLPFNILLINFKPQLSSTSRVSSSIDGTHIKVSSSTVSTHIRITLSSLPSTHSELQPLYHRTRESLLIH